MFTPLALESLYGGQITLWPNSVDKTKTFLFTPHRRSTTVSLEPNPLICLSHKDEEPVSFHFIFPPSVAVFLLKAEKQLKEQ